MSTDSIVHGNNKGKVAIVAQQLQREALIIACVWWSQSRACSRYLATLFPSISPLLGAITTLIRPPNRTCEPPSSQVEAHQGALPVAYKRYGFSTRGAFYSQACEDQFAYISLFSTYNEPQTFVEMGALDGVSLSNTLFYEETLHWHGLLVEANPAAFRRLQCNCRAATAVHAAVCSERRTVHYVLPKNEASGGIREFMVRNFIFCIVLGEGFAVGGAASPKDIGPVMWATNWARKIGKV